MSGVAARAKPIAATLVENRTGARIAGFRARLPGSAGSPASRPASTKPAERRRGVVLPREPADRDRRKESRKSGWQAGCPFGGQVQAKSDGGSPVIENRLFEPRLAVEAGSDPVAGLGHGARDPDVTRLVGTDEADCAEASEQAKDTCERGCDRRRSQPW